jgi:hypothetical protein
MRFNIKSRDGLTVRYSGAPKYNGIFGKPSYLEFAEIASPVPIEWQIGDYVDYTRTGFRYKLYTIPQVVKSARRTESGDAFVYKNVQFFCATKDLELALFRDITEYDNGIHFSSIPNVDTYEDVYGIIHRIQANMDDYAPGQWTIRAMSTSYSQITDLMEEVKAFSLSDGTCMDALNQIYALWKGISWIYKVENGKNTIVLGRPNLQDASNTTPEFSYGQGNGLKVITRAVSTKNEIATRIYAYGSDRNLPTRYYNNLTPYIKDHESVYIPNLMLPLTSWGYTGGQRDARKAYLQNTSAVNKYGLIPKVMRFDGTGDLAEIYPSVEGMTIYQVADNDFPSTGYDPYERIDEVLDAANPSDNGMYTEDSIKLKDDTVTLGVTEINTTYATLESQEALTIGYESPIYDTGTIYKTMNGVGGGNGRFVIRMHKLAGQIKCDPSTGRVLGDYLMEIPKVFIDVYVGPDLVTAKEAKVVTTRMQDVFDFVCEDIQFTTNAVGYLKIFIRCELALSPTSPQLVIVYKLAAPSLEEDNPEENTITARVEYTLDTTFKLYLKQIGFDLNAMGSSQLTDGLCTVSMRTGMCAGREFVVKEAYYNADTNVWELTCQRQDDTTLMQYFPNSVYLIQPDDRFVLLDLQMPDKYVTAAMSRLQEAAQDALSRLCKPVMAYVPEVDSKEVFMASVTLVEGLYMPIYDQDLVETVIGTELNVNWILISTVTIAENEDVIPIYSVTLRDEKVDTMLQVITGELNETQARLRDKDVDESRVPAKDDPEAIFIPVIVGVRIEADSKLFIADDNGEYNGQVITLTAVTSGINGPTYQWYYGEETVEPPEEEEGEETVVITWVALRDEVDQAYLVTADNELYYPEGKTYADFKVVVTDGAAYDDGEGGEQTPITYEDTIRIFKGGRGPKGDDGDPGEDGVSYATLHLYKSTSGDPSLLSPDDMTYDFVSRTLTPSTALNGWSVEPPTSTGSWFDVVYVTIANVSSRNRTVVVNGGWNTDIPPGDWSEPTRWAGENGLMGKIMRGVNEWSEDGLPDGRGIGVDGYQGMDEMNSEFEFYDVVYMVDPITEETLYFYCKDGTGATLVDPITDVGAGKAGDYWVRADNFEFIATKVLLAKNAYIDVLSGNGVYMYGNSGASNGVVVAGMQGGSKTEWPSGSGSMVNQVNFFAGSNVPQEAPFRVDYEGNMFATKGFLGPYEIGEDGLYRERIVRQGSTNVTQIGQYEMGEMRLYTAAAGTQSYADVTPQEITLFRSGITTQSGTVSITPALISVTGGGLSNGDIQRNGESVITFNDDSDASNLGAILHVVHCTQARYDALEQAGTLDSSTFYVITTS